MAFLNIHTTTQVQAGRVSDFLPAQPNNAMARGSQVHANVFAKTASSFPVTWDESECSSKLDVTLCSLPYSACLEKHTASTVKSHLHALQTAHLSKCIAIHIQTAQCHTRVCQSRRCTFSHGFSSSLIWYMTQKIWFPYKAVNVEFDNPPFFE